MFVGARPLDAHGLAHRLGKQGGVGGRILMAVTAITAGALDNDTADIVER